jgi:hypothetical protein
VSRRSLGERFGERFLESPDLFPARPAGERWGPLSSRLDLAGGPYLLTGLSEGQHEVLHRRFGEPTREGVPGEPAVIVRIFRAAPSDFRTYDRTGREMTVDRAHGPRSVRLAGWRFMGRLDWRPGLAGTVWTSLSEGIELLGVFENFLRVLVAYRLLESGGALVHSAGVVEKGRAYLFLGPSGAGKTTLARLARSEGRWVLSDDMNALATAPGSPGFRIERLPFAGDLGQTAAPGGVHPLGGLFRLEKGARVGVESLSSARALAGLLACCPFVNADPHRRESLERNLEGLLAVVPMGRLTFPRQGPFEEIARVLDWRGDRRDR